MPSTNAADPTDPAPPINVLVLGATGYVGGRLVPQLLEAGHRVRCLARTPAKLRDRPWRRRVEVVAGDLTDPASLTEGFADIDVVYYLVHSLGSGDDFEDLERRCARNAREAAVLAGVQHLVYLGGLGRDDDELSPHLRSRHVAGRELAAGSLPVTELRAAIILGSGSASFEMLRGLTEILPAMVTPRWVNVTRCQPIAIEDVLSDLVAVGGRVDLAGVWEIGGPDVVTYAELMASYAEVAELPARLILPVPVLTPGLSARWVGLVTDLPVGLATELVGSLQNDVIITDRPLSAAIPGDRLDVRSALRTALTAVQDLDVPTRWMAPAARAAGDPAQPKPWDPDWASGTVRTDERSRVVAATPEVVMACVRSIGGDDGWLGFEFLWALRGLGDVIVGGHGRRRRRHPSDLMIGDLVDLFRVDESTPTHLRLLAEMRMPGHGWLEWQVEPLDDGRTVLTQRALFVPKGLVGRLYWLALVPFHQLVFGRMLAELGRRSELDPGGGFPPVEPGRADSSTRTIPPTGRDTKGTMPSSELRSDDRDAPVASVPVGHMAMPARLRPFRVPSPVTAVDRLLAVSNHAGPYCSVYLAVDPVPTGGSLVDRWQPLRRDLAARGASDRALDAITARLALPGPADVGGVGIIASDDGHTVVEHGLEPPRFDFATYDTLPYAAPMIEWQQRRVSHLIVTIDDEGADVVLVGADHFTRVDHYEADASVLVPMIAHTAEAIRAELVVISGDPGLTAPLADRLSTELPLRCRTVVEPAYDELDDLAVAVVRQVSDVAARTTTDALREGRFLMAHDGMVDGREETIAALVDGSAERVLIHDDPNDQERIWIGPDPRQLSTVERDGHVQARLVDAVIRSAVLQGIEVRIIPSTGATGPDEDTAAVIGGGPSTAG